MQLRTPAEFGALIKAHRKGRKIGQAALAKAIGVSRQWVVAAEKDPSGAELGLVLRALNHLDLKIGTIDSSRMHPAYLMQPNIDIDAIVSDNREKKP
jgi:DNA-binding XRE family transcriptional regulator